MASCTLSHWLVSQTYHPRPPHPYLSVLPHPSEISSPPPSPGWHGSKLRHHPWLFSISQQPILSIFCPQPAPAFSTPTLTKVAAVSPLVTALVSGLASEAAYSLTACSQTLLKTEVGRAQSRWMDVQNTPAGKAQGTLWERRRERRQKGSKSRKNRGFAVRLYSLVMSEAMPI